MGILLNKKLNQELEKYGFAKVKLISPDEIDSIKHILDRLGFGNAEEKSNPLVFTDFDPPEKKRKIFSSLLPLAEKFAEKLLINFEPAMINVFQKRKGAVQTGMHFHPTIIDETRQQSVTMWIPMDDALKETNTLGFVPGSHKVTEKIRPANYFPHKSIDQKLIKNYIELIDVMKGEGLLFYDNLLHWSPPNNTDHIRTAVMISYIPKGMEMCYYYQKDDRILTKFRSSVEDHFNIRWNNRPQLEVLEEVEFKPHSYSMQDFHQFLVVKNPDLRYIKRKGFLDFFQKLVGCQ